MWRRLIVNIDLYMDTWAETPTFCWLSSFIIQVTIIQYFRLTLSYSSSGWVRNIEVVKKIWTNNDGAWRSWPGWVWSSDWYWWSTSSTRPCFPPPCSTLLHCWPVPGWWWWWRVGPTLPATVSTDTSHTRSHCITSPLSLCYSVEQCARQCAQPVRSLLSPHQPAACSVEWPPISWTPDTLNQILLTNPFISDIKFTQSTLKLSLLEVNSHRKSHWLVRVMSGATWDWSTRDVTKTVRLLVNI